MTANLATQAKRLQYGSVMLFTFGSGINLLLLLSSIVIVLKQSPRKPLWGLTLAFLLATLAINSTYFGFIHQMTEVAFMELKSKPDPSDFIPGTPVCSYRAISASVLSTLSILFNDAFFLFRAYRIFRRQYIPLILPATLYTSLLAVGFISSLKCAPGISVPNSRMVSILFDALSVTLNAVVAVSISWKLLRARRNAKILGANVTNISARYLTTIGIIVESAFAWSFFGLLYTISRGLNSPAQEILRGMFEITGSLSPAVLIFRILINMHYSREPGIPSTQVRLQTAAPVNVISISSSFDSTYHLSGHDKAGSDLEKR